MNTNIRILCYSSNLYSRITCGRSFATSAAKWQNSAQSFRTSSSKDRGYLLLVIPLATFGLGCWQVQRRKWKLDLIEDLKNMVKLEPIPLPENLDEIAGLEYRRVKVRGKFDHSMEVVMTPKAPMGKDSQGRGLISTGPGQTGAHIITALDVADRDLRIMINRGWVPRKEIKPHKRSKGQVTEEVEIVGVLRKPEQRPPMVAKNDPLNNQWHYRDHKEMAQALNAAPILIDADHASTVPGGPIGGQTRVNLRNEHMSYIITWYSLSAITFLGWYSKYWKRR